MKTVCYDLASSQGLLQQSMFDLESDPAEQVDVATSSPAMLEKCLSTYRTVQRCGLFIRFESAGLGGDQEELSEPIKALGHVQ